MKLVYVFIIYLVLFMNWIVRGIFYASYSLLVYYNIWTKFHMFFINIYIIASSSWVFILIYVLTRHWTDSSYTVIYNSTLYNQQLCCIMLHIWVPIRCHSSGFDNRDDHNWFIDSSISSMHLIPFQSYHDFYPELYPDTASGVPSMTAEQWCGGANELVGCPQGPNKHLNAD